MSEASGLSVRYFLDDILHPIDLQACFGNDHPIAIDLGCGKGRFLLAHAADHPDINFLGIDRMLRRIRKIDRKAVRAGLHNIRLLRMDAYYAVTYMIPADSISEYFILFPDPWPKKKHHDHRLFNTEFVTALLRTMKCGAHLHVATDHLPYFEEIQMILQNCAQLSPAKSWEPKDHERTDFELLFMATQPIGRASYMRQ